MPFRDFYEIAKNTFFTEHLWATASAETTFILPITSSAAKRAHSDDKQWAKKLKDKSYFFLPFRILENTAELWYKSMFPKTLNVSLKLWKQYKNLNVSIKTEAHSNTLQSFKKFLKENVKH